MPVSGLFARHEAWQEQGQDSLVVRFLANLWGSTVDGTSGTIAEGSDATPVSFEENWTGV